MAGKVPAAPKKMGRPRVEVDLSKLPAMCRIQCTAEECASVLGISVDTLDSRLVEAYGCTFSEFYKRNSGGGKSSLRRLQWKSARGGNVAMLIWLGKQWLGQRDQAQHAEDDTPPQSVQVIVQVQDASVPRADA